jgi:hypothetical protein
MAMINAIFTQLNTVARELFIKAMTFKFLLSELHGTEHNKNFREHLEDKLMNMLKEFEDLRVKVKICIIQQQIWEEHRGEEASFAGNSELLEPAVRDLSWSHKTLREAADTLHELFNE